MRLSQRFGALLERLCGGSRDFPSALLPAERRGGGFSVVPVGRKRGEIEIQARSELWRRNAARFGLGLWGSGSLLFDNCIGRKRDVGGGVLAGLRSSTRVLGVSLRA